MIISFSNNFLLVKPRKTAGTSVELALSPFLQAGDVATPIEPDEEPDRQVKDGVFVGRPKRRGIRLRDHSPLWRAKAVYGKQLDGLHIITIARNPWDRAVSQFFWSMRKTDIRKQPKDVQRAAFAKYTRRYGPRTALDYVYGRKRQRALSSHHLYSRAGVNQSDFVIFFERLQDDLDLLAKGLNLSGSPRLANAKSGIRPNASRSWQEYYDQDLADFVAHHCAAEIRDYGYDFLGEATPVYKNSIW